LSVSGIPPFIKDGSGIVQVIPTTFGAGIQLTDGTLFLINLSIVGGPLTKARLIPTTTVQGFETAASELYTDASNGQTILDQGLTVKDFYGA